MNYRNEAKKFLKCAQEELSTNDDKRLKYAALELRMAMEAITYDRALAYKDEIPQNEYEAWQPKKVMQTLLEIDPTADKDCSLAVGIEEEYGKPASEMKFLGTEKVLNISILKSHYDALGSYLHMPTIKQMQGLKYQDPDRLRSRCEQIILYIEQVFVSPVFNVTFGNFATLDCLECGKPIRKRIPHGKSEVFVECYNNNGSHKCLASYTIIDNGNGQSVWHPLQPKVECGNDDCRHKIVVWQQEIKIGSFWTCPKCKGRNIFSLGIRFESKSICRDFHSRNTANAQKTSMPSALEVTNEQKTAGAHKTKEL